MLLTHLYFIGDRETCCPDYFAARVHRLALKKVYNEKKSQFLTLHKLSFHSMKGSLLINDTSSCYHSDSSVCQETHSRSSDNSQTGRCWEIKQKMLLQFVWKDWNCQYFLDTFFLLKWLITATGFTVDRFRGNKLLVVQ